MSRDQNAGRSYRMKIDNSSIERVEEFKYLGTMLTDQNSIQEEIKSRWSWGMLAIIQCRIFCLPLGACGTYGGGEKCAQGSGGETWGKETIGETQT